MINHKDQESSRWDHSNQLHKGGTAGYVEIYHTDMWI